MIRKTTLPLTVYPDDAFTAPEVQAVLQSRKQISDLVEAADREACLAWPIDCYHTAREFVEEPIKAGQNFASHYHQDPFFLNALVAAILTWTREPHERWTLGRWIASLDQRAGGTTAEDLVCCDPSTVVDVPEAFVDYKSMAKMILAECQRHGVQSFTPDLDNSLRPTFHAEQHRRIQIAEEWQQHFSAWNGLSSKAYHLELPASILFKLSQITSIHC